MLNKYRTFGITASVLLTMLVVGCAAGTMPANPQANPVSGAPMAAQEIGQETQPRSVTVEGFGTASAEPDIAHVQLGVEIINADAQQAIQESNQRMSAVIEAVKEMDVEDKDIQTTRYNISVQQPPEKARPMMEAPEPAQPTEEEQPAPELRYRVNNRVRVTLRDLSQVGQLLQNALDAGANTVDNVNFSIENPEALQQEARDRAIADAKDKAEQLAAGFDAAIGPVRQITERGGRGVVAERVALETEAAQAAGGRVPIAGGEVSVSVDIQAIFELTSQ